MSIIELFNKRFAPWILLKDKNKIRATSRIIYLFPKVYDFITGNFNEGIQTTTKNNVITVQIPSIKLNLTKEFMDISDLEGNKGSLSLYIDYINAKVYDYDKKIEDVFDLTQMDLASIIDAISILDFIKKFLSKIGHSKLTRFILDSIVYTKDLSHKQLSCIIMDYTGYILSFKDFDISIHLEFISTYFKFIPEEKYHQIKEVMIDKFSSYLKVIHLMEDRRGIKTLITYMDNINSYLKSQDHKELFDKDFGNKIDIHLEDNSSKDKLIAYIYLKIFIPTKKCANNIFTYFYLQSIHFIYEFGKDLSKKEMRELNTYINNKTFSMRGYINYYGSVGDLYIHMNKILTRNNLHLLEHIDIFKKIVLDVFKQFTKCDGAWGFPEEAMKSNISKLWFKENMKSQIDKLKQESKGCGKHLCLTCPR